MARTPIGVIDHPNDPTDPTHAVTEEELDEHINSPTPHPAYDDPMGLVTYFENGLA